ncbi:YihY/virulence factor BrkB family protein [Rubrivirga sp.]|uniref:YihY/virulence factor BrkB family protein n=1 Tax=Rubrivirga sp. TaxID=1885344 RepID=UPI003C791F9A
MSVGFSDVKSVVSKTISEIGNDDVPTLSAAIAYYTVFSLPPLLATIVAIAGVVLGPERVAEIVSNQVGSAVGPSAAAEVETMIQSARSIGGGVWSTIVGIAALLFGATGAFAQLQKALNRAWEVEEATEGGGIKAVIFKRVLSFGMVLTIAFMLLVSLAITAVLSELGSAASSVAGDGVAGFAMQVVNFFVSLGVISALFAVLFKYLPDAEISWKDVAVGAVVTGILFTIGKSLIGVYLAHASPGSAFGAAGSLALILIWVYYSSLIVLVGAEFTQAWSEKVGKGIDPDAPIEDGPDQPAHPVAEARDPAPY